MRASRWAVAARAGIAAVGLTAAGGLVGVTPAWAVAGSNSSNGTYAFVAEVRFGQFGVDAGAHACSGALVNAQWVLTTASCVTPDGGTLTAGAPASPTTVVVGRPDLSGTGGASLSVVQVVPRPDRDLALLRLAATTTVTPVSIATTAPAAGQAWHLAGYGRTHGEWVPNQQHQADFAVQSTSGATASLTPAGDAALCKGDAGAPALVDTGNGAVALAAVAAGASQGGCDGAGSNDGHDATATRVDDIADWIAQTATDGLPGTAAQWAGARLMASGDYTGHGRSDLIVVWTDGKVSLFPSDGVGGFQAERVLAAANDRWKTARLITGGDFDGGNLFDLLVVWNNGTASNFVDVSTAGLGTEKAMTAPAGASMSWATQISAGRFGSSSYVTDLVVLWNDGEVSLYTQVGGGKFGTEHQLLKPTAIWKDATVLTSGQFSGKTNWDLMVRWVDGEVDNYPQTSASGLGTEHRVLNTNTAWRSSTVMTTGHYTANALVDDILVRWADGHTSMFVDSTLDKLGTERTFVPVASTATAASAGSRRATRVKRAAAAADATNSLIETFDYPNADQAPAGLTLVSGDGHILWVSCDAVTTGDVQLIHVHTSSLTEFCFQVSGTTGLLNLQVPAVYDIRGDGYADGAGHNLTATVQVNGSDPTTVPIDPNGDTGVGIGDPKTNKPAVLLQLRVTP